MDYRGSLQMFQKLIHGHFCLPKDTFQNWQRQIEAIMPWYGNTKVRFYGMS
jgi:hypothetical protein